MTPVTIEALNAAAKMAGTISQCQFGNGHIPTIYRCPEIYPTEHALARMIEKHEPELIAESFDARTSREWDAMENEARFGGIEAAHAKYREFIRQYQDEAK
jgi:hypothetical protein